MRVLMVRHGQTPSNVAGLLDTAFPGPGLTTLGERQAAAVPAALRGRPVEAIAVSSLTRTSLTAAPLAGALGLVPLVLDGLREVEAGDLEMSGHHAAHLSYLSTVFAWARGDVRRRMPGGPDGRAFLDRFDGALGELAGHGSESVVVVSHGAAIRTWSAARVRGLDVDAVERTPLDNTGAIEVEGDPVHGWTLVAWTPSPLGGAALASFAAEDPTGEAVDP